MHGLIIYYIKTLRRQKMLIIDGHDVYEIDEECVKKHKVNKECRILEKLQEKQQYDKKYKYTSDSEKS